MESKAKGGGSSAGWLLILPLVLILVPFFIVPIIGVVAASFVQSDGFGGIIPSFTLEITRASSPRGLPISCTGRR